MTTQEFGDSNGETVKPGRGASGEELEELRQHALDLLSSREETLKIEIETMLSQHRARLDAARRSILVDFERERGETGATQSISSLLNEEESGSERGSERGH
ncbi:hypothetical protein MOSE0_K10858 [Monosporozyma servazzii]